MGQDGPNISPVNAASTAVNNTFQVQSGSPSSILATVANPFPFGINQAPRSRATPDFFYGKSFAMKVPGDPKPYVQQWNVAVERQIGQNSSLTVAYAGSKGTHLLLQGFATVPSININQIPDQYLSLGAAALLAQVTNPFFGTIKTPGSVLSQPTVAAGMLLRPFPQFDRVYALDPYKGKSNYHSLQTSFLKRFGSSGGVLTVAYTYSRLRSNTDSVTNFLDENGLFAGQVQDNNHLDREYSLSGYDIPHNLSIGYGVDLPFGSGKRFLANSTGVAGVLVSGWRVNGITTFRSGPPVGISQIRAGTALSQLGGGGGYIWAPGVSMRPDVVAGCDKGAPGSRQFRVDHGWFNTQCWVPVPFDAMRFGNQPRLDPNTRVDGINNWDFSLAKRFLIAEPLALQFTAEFYNLFNHARFGAPVSTVGDPQFGLVTSQVNPPRAVQFGLRLDF
jgi:hypothetical protein